MSYIVENIVNEPILDINNMSYEETAYYIYGVDIDNKYESNIS